MALASVAKKYNEIDAALEERARGITINTVTVDWWSRRLRIVTMLTSIVLVTLITSRT